MPILYLVRHGQAAAGWDEDRDPGLSDRGRKQAQQATTELAGIKATVIVSSPMRRCQETAALLARLWDAPARIEPAVSEIPSPVRDLDKRSVWLREIFGGTWDDAGAATRAWRDDVVFALLSITSNAVIFTHFVAINAAVGAATGDDRVLCCHPDNCSITILKSDRSAFSLDTLGAQADTKVN